MTNTTAKSALGWLRRLAIAATVTAGSAQAAVFSGVWDPDFGAPFAGLGWSGSATYYVPDSCIPTTTTFVYNTPTCGGDAVVTAAQVTLYDSSTLNTLSTLVFDPSSLSIFSLAFQSTAPVVTVLSSVPPPSTTPADLVGLNTSYSNWINPTENLWAYGVASSVEFSLFFTFGDELLANGPHLAWRNCSSYSHDDDEEYYSTSSYSRCTSGVNNPTNDPALDPRFTITRVPEPSSLALACLGVLALVPRRVRKAIFAAR